jgi:hypothetical protein
MKYTMDDLTDRELQNHIKNQGWTQVNSGELMWTQVNSGAPEWLAVPAPLVRFNVKSISSKTYSVVLSVLLRCTDSDYPFGIFYLFS